MRKVRKKAVRSRRHLKMHPRWRIGRGPFPEIGFSSSCSQRLSQGSVAFTAVPFKGIPVQPRIGQIPEDLRLNSNQRRLEV